MHSPLLVERKDPKWFLLGQVLALVSARRAQQEFAKYEITPIKTVIEAVKIAIVSMFFSVECSYVVQELKKGENCENSWTSMRFPLPIRSIEL